MLQAILNKSWKKLPTKQQLYGHLPPISKTVQVRQTRHAGHCWRSKDKLISDVFYGPHHMDVLLLAEQQKPIYISPVWTYDVVWKTCWEWWMIGTKGERERIREIHVGSTTWGLFFYQILLHWNPMNMLQSKNRYMPSIYAIVFFDSRDSMLLN